MDTKKYLIRVIFFIILVFVVIIATDYYVDSYASFRLTYKKIGKISTESNYCVGTDIPLSERKAKWGTLLYSKPVDNMILGSSRSRQFSHNNIGLENLYNLSVAGGSSVNDYMSEIYILHQLDKMPQNILIEISPSIFNKNSGETRWKEWGDASYNMEYLMAGKDINVDESYLLDVQLKDIISPAYFKYNFRQLLDGKRSYIKTNNNDYDDYLSTEHIDGSLGYSIEFQNKYNSDAILKRSKDVCANKNVYCCSNYDELDVELINNFEKLVSYLKNNGVNVSLYLPPYSEYIYEYICSDYYYSSILAVEDYIIPYAEKNGIQVYGSYNPVGSDLELSDFYDEYHIKESKVLDTLWVRNDNLDNYWSNGYGEK